MNKLTSLVVRCVPHALAISSMLAVSQPLPAQQSKAALTVSAGLSQTVDWPTTVRASGQIAAWQEAVVSTRANGLPLTVVNAEVGQSVRKGEVLARFDDRAARAELAQAEANLVREKAAENQASLNLKRAVLLRGSGAISEESILQAETQYETAKTQVAVANASVEAAKVRLENTVVVAPDSGQIVTKNATLGQAFATTTELFRLIRQHRLEWRAEVNTVDLLRLVKNQKAAIVLPDGSQLLGRVRNMAPALAANSRLAVVNVDIIGNKSAKPSMFAEGTIETGSTSAIVIPAESVAIRDGRSFVFVLDGDRVRRTPVTTGRQKDGLIEISKGIGTGQRLIVRGAGFLSDGDRVAVSAMEPVTMTGSKQQ